MKIQSENRFLYMIKGIACMAVVLLHVPLPSSIAETVRALARFAVPMFFLITGRYMPSDRTALCRRLKKTVQLTATVWLVCMVWSVGYMHFCGRLCEWLRTYFTRGEWLRLLLYNSGKCIFVPPLFSDFMWYLFALIYVYLLAILIAGWREKAKNMLCVILLACFFLFQYTLPNFSFEFHGIDIRDSRLYRNFLFFGMSFVLLGQWIGRAKVRSRTKPIPLALTALLGGLLAIAESLLIFGRELPVGAAVLSVALALLAEHIPEHGSRVLAYAGKHLSGHVYCWHVLVINALKTFVVPHMAGMPVSLLLPPLAIVLSLLLAQALVFLKRRPLLASRANG